MPKVRVLSRNPDDYLRETKKDIFKGILCYYHSHELFFSIL